MIIIKNVTIQLQKKNIVSNLSCSIEPGRITTFMGGSGAGKTTLLRSIIGLLIADKGTIIVNGHDLNDLSMKVRSEEIGYVFQDFNLFDNMTVLENCIDPQLLHDVTYQEAYDRAVGLLKELDMYSFLERYPSQLSGGQKQRIAIVRALCLRPKVLLLDEPTASLDPLNTEVLVVILKKLAKQGLTIALSSQDMGFVSKVFDRIYYLANGFLVEECDTKSDLNACPLIKKFLEH